MKKQILLCDDDPGVTDVIKIMLEMNGYEVLALETGKGIQKKIEKFLPKLILLDYWLPGLDGKEIVHLLKTNSKTQKIPIILISAINNIEAVTKTTMADDFISKPFDMEEFLAKVKKYTD